MEAVVVGGSGERVIPPRKINRARVIHREGCLHPEAEFARKAQFPAYSASNAMTVIAVDTLCHATGASGSGGRVERIGGGGGGGDGGGGEGGCCGGGSRRWWAVDDSGAQDWRPRAIHRKGCLRPEAEGFCIWRDGSRRAGCAVRCCRYQWQWRWPSWEAVVGGGGRGVISPGNIGHTRAIQRERCLRLEEEFARNVQFPANSPSATMAAIALDESRRVAGPGGGSVGRSEERRRRRWWRWWWW